MTTMSIRDVSLNVEVGHGYPLVFLTYALGVPLRKMLDPVSAQARVPV
jgi:hypothetical protein